MDEKDCELLLKLYEYQNITKVAELLYISQPAISKRIQKLEGELGCQLMLRSKKGVVFTAAGEGIIPYMNEILENKRFITEYIATTQDHICGTIDLGCALSFARWHLPTILEGYIHNYPLVNLKIQTGQSRELFRMLQRNQISIAIVRGEFQWKDGSRLISTEPMCFVCSNSNAGRPLTEYPYIGHHMDTALAAKVHEWLSSHGLDGHKVKIWLDNIDSCKEMVRHNIGWSILPSICLDDFDGYRKPLYLNDGSQFTCNTYILYKSPYEQLPQVKLFIQALLEKRRA